MLGPRFNVFVLGAAAVFAFAAIVAAGIAARCSCGTIVVALSAGLMSLQLGYIAGGVAAEYLSKRSKLLGGMWVPTQHY